MTPPKLTMTSQLLVHFTEWTSGWSWVRSLAFSVGSFVAVALLERVCGITVNVAFFYLLASAFSLWCLGERWGLAVSAAGAVVSALTKHAQLHDVILAAPVSPLAEGWSLAARLLSFALLAVLVNGLRGILSLERWRADHDGLTGALNKQAFQRAVAGALARARLEEQGVLFVFIDLDGFKAVNDQHGHAAGDQVLCTFANAARHAIRGGDLFARVGGDEFGLLLSVPDEVDGTRVAGLLHQRLTGILASTGYDVTCSMGALALGRDEVDTDQGTLEQADALMYEAKRAGKNALRVARSGSVGPAIRSAFAALPEADDGLDELLAHIDLAERRHGWFRRRAA